MRGRIELAPGVQMALTTNAMVRYQEASGESILDGVQALEDGGLDFKRLRMMIWVGLVDRNLSLEDAGDLIDAMGVQQAGEKLAAAFKAAFPDADKESKPAAGKD